MTATAVTLGDYSQLMKQGGDYLTAGVIDTLRKDSYLLEKMPFPNTGSLTARGLRIKSLPSIQNRQINGSYTHAVGQVEPLEETGFLFGGKVQTDRVYKDASGMLIQDVEAFNVEMHTRALSYAWNDHFINNSPGSVPNSIVGMRYRFLQDFSGQIIDGGGVDVSPDAASLSTNFNTLFDKIQSLIHACDGHTCDMLVMNDTLKLRIESGLRQLGLFSTTQDNFGRTVSTWGSGGPMLIDLGTKGDQSTKIITDTEGSTGAIGGGTLTSAMAFKFGQDYLTGWQLNPMQTYRWSEGVINYVEMDWYAGLFITNPRSCAWLYNIQAI